MRITIVLYLSLFLLIGCTQNFQTKKQIIKFEISNNCQIHEFILINNFKPYFSNDSAIALQIEMDSFLLEKMHALNQELASINQRIIRTEKEQNESENPQMKKAIAYSLYQLDGLKKQQNEIISIYETQPELTQMGWYKNQIQKYKTTPKQIIAQSIKVTFIGTQGKLPFANYECEYFFDPDKRILLARYNKIQTCLH